ncbi:MAG TPA: SpoIID/LytB domain-containing protein, partial [Actinotalea sp.]|nr:SpoIID/LytB domain-containing protein [Actinotalea sp.]
GPVHQAGSAAAATAAAAGDEITFTGHGWGHGRGMGQYGALGYALDHGWGYGRILSHYYGGTELTTLPSDRPMSVEITRLTGSDTIVQGWDLTVAGIPVPGSGFDYLRVRAAGDGTFRADSGTGCGGPWVEFGGVLPSGLGIVATRDQGQDANLIRTCEATTSVGYRGTMRVVAAAGTRYTINDLPTETYLRGVVPRESPASWGSLGSGRGMEALKAQSVAARSYVLASTGRSSGALTCDTTACQVYGGAVTASGHGPGATLTPLEQVNTNVAINATARQVMRFPSGAIARTEYRSSTGGWTAGGVFPAVQDLGDSVRQNPNHVWTVSLTESQIATRLGLSGIRSVTVTARNGLGDLGGRVLSVAVVDGGGVTHTYTGGQFRTAMGTATFKSDWFAVASVSRAEAEAVVKALYQDLLGRAVDPDGLRTWSSRLMTGTSQSELVGTLTRSEEYVRLRITQAYQDVLGRAPEPAGMAHWYDRIMQGRASVDDVKRRFYDSQEYYLRSGGTDTGYITLLYRTMFEREGSA